MKTVLPPMHVGVIGGSYAGLATALTLRQAGHKVELFERSEAASRVGGGIVVQPDFADYLERNGYGSQQTIGVPTVRRRFLGPDGSVGHTTSDSVFYSGWDALLRSLNDALGEDGVHRGVALTRFEQDGHGVTAEFSDGVSRRFDLLIGADGVGSAVRSQLLPEVHPRYAGYVGYRGLIPEYELSAEAQALIDQSFVLFAYPGSHILNYLIPGHHGELEPGQRRYNWVWYVNTDESRELPGILTDLDGVRHRSSLGPGEMSPATLAYLTQHAEEKLPPTLRQVVQQTSEPFVQGIFDIQVDQMRFGRVLLLGDAASMVRPHTASGTSKAVGDATSLASHLISGPTLDEALDYWEAERLAVADRLGVYGQRIAANGGLGLAA